MAKIYGTPGYWKKQFFAILLMGVICFSFVFLYLYFNQSSAPKSVEATNASTQSATTLFYNKIGEDPDFSLQAEKSDRNKYSLELLNTSERQEAIALVKKLQQEKIMAYYFPYQKGPKVMFKVRIGLYENIADAEKVALQMKSDQGISAKIVKM